ncbi:MAG: hypothetical protein FWD73_15005 [Polyangiaceae bacterium]|nr:hypothetical protein [Polyangiaceae bacterium]
MDADELFDHAIAALPEAVGDLLREERDPFDYVFANFDGSSELGMALIASDLACELGVDPHGARSEVERMIFAAGQRGEELVVSLMVTKEVLGRILLASNVDDSTRLAVRVWLDDPAARGHYRVVAIAGEDVRAASVNGMSELDGAPSSSVPSSSMLN